MNGFEEHPERILTYVPVAFGFEEVRGELMDRGENKDVKPGGEVFFTFPTKDAVLSFLKGMPEILKGTVYPRCADTLEEALWKEATEGGFKVAVAESCTGGLVSERITRVSGSSRYFWGGIVSYDDAAKEKLLGVRRETISANGAVSREVVEEMVDGIVRISGASLAVSVSGIAGPEGGTPDKPVGTVWFSVSGPSGRKSEMVRFIGDREKVRMRASSHALWLLLSEVAR